MFHPDDTAGRPHCSLRVDGFVIHYHYLDLVPKGRDEGGRGP
jgi:hypothetical protein